MLDTLAAFLALPAVSASAKAGTLVVMGLILAWLLSRVAYQAARQVLTPERAALVRRLVGYTIAGLAAASALRELGFDLSVLLGAAGVLTVALGFASQTSASNAISGLFLIGEQPFTVGDFVEVGGAQGEVIAVDLLSVKLRTIDNLFVRVPNETVMKSAITNYTRFPIRRLPLRLAFAWEADVDRARDVLMSLAAQNPLILDEPAPLFRFQSYGEAGVDVDFAVWVARENFIPLKDELSRAVKRALDEAGVRLALPRRTIMGGPEPLQVQLVTPTPPPPAS